jgi:polyisoprenoid-binding protein YceI
MRISLLAAAAAMAFSFSAAAATKWTPDYAKSKLQFEGKFGQNTVTGTFGKYTADIAFDASDLAGSKVVVKVDMKSAATSVTPDAIYNKPTDGALPGAGWFNAATNAESVFTSTAISSKGGDKYEAKGTLNLRGVTKEIVLPFTVKITGNTAVAEGSATVNRIDFGIKGDSPQYSLPKPVPYEVKIMFSVTATK